MKGLLAGALLLPSVASAFDLDCQAESSIPGIDTFNTTISIDPRSGNASTFAGDGTAKGVVKTTDSAYLGELTSATGKRLWLYVDRYRGTFVITAIPHADGAKALLWGDCKPATQRF
jgi:hypothetical protein